MINLISRFYDVNEGRITIDGIDIRDIKQEELRAQIGVVLQETFLFSGTILDNIRYSKPNATLGRSDPRGEDGQCARFYRQPAGRL